MKIICMFKNKIFIKAQYAIVIAPFCFTFFAAEKPRPLPRPPFRTSAITGAITSPQRMVNSPLSHTPTSPITINRPPIYDSGIDQPQSRYFDQKYPLSSSTPTDLLQHFVFPPTITQIPSAPPFSECGNPSEYGDEENNDEENSPHLLKTEDSLFSPLEKTYYTSTQSPTVPTPEDIIPSKKLNTLQKIHDGTKKLFGKPFIPQKTIDRLEAEDQAKKHAALTLATSNAAIPLKIKKKETLRKVEKLTQELQNAQEETKQRQRAVAQQIASLSSSAPSEQRITTPSPTTPSPQLPRGRSKSLSFPVSQTRNAWPDERPE